MTVLVGCLLCSDCDDDEETGCLMSDLQKCPYGRGILQLKKLRVVEEIPTKINIKNSIGFENTKVIHR